MENQGGFHISLYGVVRDVVKSLWMVAAAALTGGLLAYSAVQLTYEPQYTSAVIAAVYDAGDADYYKNVEMAAQVADTFNEMLGSEPVRTAIADDLGVETLDAVLRASVRGDTNLIQIAATANNSRTAFAAIQSLVAQFGDLFDESFSEASFETAREPRVPTAASNSMQLGSRMGKAGLACGAAMLLGIVLLSVWRGTARTRREVERCLGLGCLACIPHERNAEPAWMPGQSEVSEAFAQNIGHLRARMELEHELNGRKIFAFTSAVRGEGRSTIAAGAAFALAQSGKRVLLIDADLRNPSQHRLWDLHQDIAEAPTLVDYLQGTADDYRTIDMMKKQGVFVMVHDTACPDSTELLAGERMQTLLRDLCDSMDYILLDTPPVHAAADAAVLLPAVDAAVLVVREDCCGVSALQRAVQLLFARDGGKCLGCVYNDAHAPLLPMRRGGKTAARARRVQNG